VPSPRTKPNVSYLLIGVCLGALWALGYRGEEGGVAGYLARWSGTLMLPVVIAYLIGGRRGDWRSFSRWFLWMSLVLTPLVRLV